MLNPINFNENFNHIIQVPALYSGAITITKSIKQSKCEYAATLISGLSSDFITFYPEDAELSKLVDNSSNSDIILADYSIDPSFTVEIKNELNKPLILKLSYLYKSPYIIAERMFPVYQFNFKIGETKKFYQLPTFISENLNYKFKVQVVANNGFITSVKYKYQTWNILNDLTLSGQIFKRTTYYALPFVGYNTPNNIFLMEIEFEKTNLSKNFDVEIFYTQLDEDDFITNARGAITDYNTDSRLAIYNRKISDLIIIGAYLSMPRFLMVGDENIEINRDFGYAIIPSGTIGDLISVAASNKLEIQPSTTNISIGYVSNGFKPTFPNPSNFHISIIESDDEYCLINVFGFIPFLKGVDSAIVEYFLIADIFETIAVNDDGAYNTLFEPKRGQRIYPSNDYLSLNLKIKSVTDYYIRLFAHDKYSDLYFAYEARNFNSIDFDSKKVKHRLGWLSIALTSVSVMLALLVIFYICVKMKTKSRTESKIWV